MDDKLSKEIQAFEKMKPVLEEHHMGKFVVFKDEQLQGSFDSFDNAVKESVERFGKGPYLIRQVGAPPAFIPASIAYRAVNAVY